MRIKRYGWVRDIPDQRDFRYQPPPRLARALPPRVDLRAGFPPCYNQGELGSCTANAISGALQFLEAKEGAGTPVMPSRLFIYFNERALEGTVDSDSGAQIRDGIKSVARRGFCPEELWPYDIRRFADKPPERCYRAALKDRVSQYLRLDHVSPLPLLTCLASGYPFVFGFSVYESFESRVSPTPVWFRCRAWASAFWEGTRSSRAAMTSRRRASRCATRGARGGGLAATSPCRSRI